MHVNQYGTFITTELSDDRAIVTARTTVVNESDKTAVFDIEETIVDASGNPVASAVTRQLTLSAGDRNEYFTRLTVANPGLWSIEMPTLHTLETRISSAGKVVDAYETKFGIRTVRFDANEGFFLNDKPVKIKGACLHQDHAGVGKAIPDALQEYRVKQVKEHGGERNTHGT